MDGWWHWAVGEWFARGLATVAGFACFGGGLLHLLVSGVGCQSACVLAERVEEVVREVNIGGEHVTVSEKSYVWIHRHTHK